MSRSLPSFNDSLEWNLVARQSIVAQRNADNSWIPIPARSFVLTSYVVQVGIKTTGGKSSWFTGGWASMIAQSSPSSQSEFVAAVFVQQRRIRLGTLNLFTFPKVMTPYLLEIKFPWWFDNVLLEVWRYDGPDIDDLQRLDQIESKVDQL